MSGLVERAGEGGLVTDESLGSTGESLGSTGESFGSIGESFGICLRGGEGERREVLRCRKLSSLRLEGFRSGSSRLRASSLRSDSSLLRRRSSSILRSLLSGDLSLSPDIRRCGDLCLSLDTLRSGDLFRLLDSTDLLLLLSCTGSLSGLRLLLFSFTSALPLPLP